MWIRYFWVYLVCVLLCSGCVTSRNRQEVLSRILKDIEEADKGSPDKVEAPVDRSGDSAGADAPDRPVSELPPVPVPGSSTDVVDTRLEEPRTVGKNGRDTIIKGSLWGGEATSEMRRAARTPSDLTIQPDCLVQITVDEDHTLDDSYAVNDIGAVDLKYIGPIILINKTETEAAQKISEVLVGREFKKATVRVRILRASYDKIKMAGAVMKEGLVRIGAGDSITLNDALLRAGGIKAAARGAKIRIVRDGLLSAVGENMKGEEYSLMNESGTPTVPDVMLNNNDVAIVFTSEAQASVAGGEKEILVVGEVNRPGLFRFSADEPCTIMHLIFKMGGLPPYANRKTIIVRRVEEDGHETEIKVNAEEILKEGRSEDDIELMNGDTVVIPARRISLF